MTTCTQVHARARELPLHRFPFDAQEIPLNGIYLLFEEGEDAHDGPRIVRVGTHTGEGQLRSRLRQHFPQERKDRSVFRKNLGRCLLARDQDPYREIWDLDLTTRASRANLPRAFDAERQAEIEHAVTARLRDTFTFVVVPIAEKEHRLRLEAGLASLLFACPECTPSPCWLGRQSPKALIRDSGLWQVNSLRGTPLAAHEVSAVFG